jgi:hypothetical protein
MKTSTIINFILGVLNIVLLIALLKEKRKKNDVGSKDDELTKKK